MSKMKSICIISALIFGVLNVDFSHASSKQDRDDRLLASERMDRVNAATGLAPRDAIADRVKYENKVYDMIERDEADRKASQESKK